MAAPPGTLGDFFAKKGKTKKTLGVNLNKVEAKTEEKKVTKVVKEEEGWEEDEVVAPTMKVESVAKLSREEEKKEEEETSAPAWGNKTKKQAESAVVNDKRFPTLAKALGSTNINLDDEPKVNIKTTKNAFAALEADEDGSTKPRKEIRPSLVNKQKGETQKDALARELKKAKDEKKKKKKEDDETESESEEEEVQVEEKKKPEKKKEKKVIEAPKVVAKEEKEDDGPKIEPDLEASRKKYEGRRKLPKPDLPRSEIEEQKENRPQQVSSKKKKFMVEEEEKPKLLVWED